MLHKNGAHVSSCGGAKVLLQMGIGRYWASLITAKCLVSGPSGNNSRLSVVTNGSMDQAIFMHGTSTITENTPKFKQEHTLEQAPISVELLWRKVFIRGWLVFQLAIYFCVRMYIDTYQESR